MEPTGPQANQRKKRNKTSNTETNHQTHQQCQKHTIYKPAPAPARTNHQAKKNPTIEAEQIKKGRDRQTKEFEYLGKQEETA